jgi:AraC-like DNA-binding protein
MSASTLKRRLSKEGASYQALTSVLKRELAESFLKEKTPIADIAMILGFSETSAFTRAFKKWSGITPSQFDRD